ncbi:MAG: tetratricopeptide repeat protein [Acidobacteriaceae bacterium]|nr:tetratricopeptide repeat protein [Acidobacteriaceae bacterium]MBV9767874.1 tetratricopeptide repeat protein [Acidobacteriaceae bacterium]
MRATSGILLILAVTVAINAGQSARDDGIAAFKNGRYSVALAKLKGIPDKTAAVFLALTEAALGDCKTALPGLTMEITDPVLYRLSTLAAVKCYSVAGDDANAFRLLQILKERFPNDPDVLYAAAKLHMKGFNDATFAMFQRAPASYRVHELSAEIFEVENRYSEAIAEYRKALELNPNAPDLHFRLGRAILLQSHDPAALVQASSEFRSELKLNPEDGACEFQLGQIAQVQDKTTEAKSHFQRALSFSPAFIQALIALGKLETQEKQYGEAISLLSRAITLQPANETAHYALLTAYRDSGQIDKAKAEKATLDRLQKPPEGEFADFLKKLGEKQQEQ